MPQVPGKLGACEMFPGVLFFLKRGLWWFLSLPCRGMCFTGVTARAVPIVPRSSGAVCRWAVGLRTSSPQLLSLFSSKSVFAQALGSTIWSYNYPPTIQWEQKGGRFICYAFRGICKSFLLHSEHCCYLYAMCNLLEILQLYCDRQCMLSNLLISVGEK